MAHYAIGDLQGCYRELTALLQKIEFNHGTDTLWLVGDIVNRGEQSLECLQFCMAHPDSVQMVLGNHDLHLLAIIYGHGKHKRSDTLQAILNHPQLSQMRDWLRQQPLMVHNDRHVLVHAGLLPEWTVAQAQDLADEVQQHLRGNQASDYFANMYGNQPDAWAETLTGYDRLRCITNALTRMRVLTAQNQFEPNFKSVRADIPEHHYAWFDAPNRQHLSHKIVFGHWSALGFVNEQQVIALDTGALWGGQLTAIDLATEQITQIQSQSKNDWRE